MGVAPWGSGCPEMMIANPKRMTVVFNIIERRRKKIKENKEMFDIYKKKYVTINCRNPNYQY